MKNIALAALTAFSLFAIPALAPAADAPSKSKPVACCCGDTCKCEKCSCSAGCTDNCTKGDTSAKCPCKK
ncbi:hypothetical protein CVU37_05935 [candidate division BRC1 bacterium HGW-BRC1-1]|jgi:hypothetical protein|nr:MAG: hypothetical protein CVU37_05935 [candidate division BRC1 bacterium HGW-BRC1-1]